MLRDIHARDRLRVNFPLLATDAPLVRPYFFSCCVRVKVAAHAAAGTLRRCSQKHPPVAAQASLKGRRAWLRGLQSAGADLTTLFVV